MYRLVITSLLSSLLFCSCLQYEKEIMTLHLDPKIGSGKLEMYCENITSDEEKPEARKEEIQELIDMHNRKDYKKSWEKMGFYGVRTKLIRKDQHLNGYISGRFRSISLLAWNEQLLQELSVDDKTYKMDFGQADSNAEIIMHSTMPIVSSNANSISKDKKQASWKFRIFQKRILVMQFDEK